ncbi:unnamed protein product [Cylicocyclus nassatus]|uniref:Cytochrome b-c1 complex subunit Rieske, mitochondrial n=1 Tax=Cylicocyclus nassatus TaxID=53992 RepID=A0AA36H396_CYLNA|nr:unnamed protein product [Cylicocyclus nassatus]
MRSHLRLEREARNSHIHHSPCSGAEMASSLRVCQKLPSSLANGIVNAHARRLVHTDIKFPDMSQFRRDSTLDINKAARESEDERRAFTHSILYGAGGAISLWAGKEMLQTMVYYKNMPADTLAIATTQIDTSEIPEGETRRYNFQGKPVFVRHRTQEEIAKEKDVNIANLRHPERDDERVQRAGWSVVMGICPHLGCVPIPNAGDYNGYFCPCHGGHFDTSGRIRKGPSPLNLEFSKIINFLNHQC